MACSTIAPPRQDLIRVVGAREHNLKGIDVEFPRQRLTWLTGVSGSGKSSLAFDTLYTEGQRRFIEGFSTRSRQFLERLDRPDVEEISNLPPAIALRQHAGGTRNGATLAIATELNHYLRALFAQIGEIHDPETGRVIRRDSPASVATLIGALPAGRRYLVAFRADAPAVSPPKSSDRDRLIDDLIARGLTRAVVAGRIVNLDRDRRDLPDGWPSHIIVDRLVAGRGSNERVFESLELAFREGNESCAILLEGPVAEDDGWSPIDINDAHWSEREFQRRLIDPRTGDEWPEPTPALFSFQSPLGACPVCHGRGRVADSSKKEEVCPACEGMRLNSAALSVRVDGMNIAQWQQLTVEQAHRRFEELDKAELMSASIGRTLLTQILARLTTLTELGLSYLELDRPLETLSTGESRRVALTTAIGANLVNMLYVLDEPTAGLHPRDRQDVLRVLQSLRDAPNTVVVIDHDPTFRAAVDWVVQLGPGAGREGGNVVYQGVPEEFGNCPEPRSVEAVKNDAGGSDCLEPDGPAIVLTGCRRHNLRDLTVSFPLNQLVGVSGVSGSGKSTLVSETLYRAVRHLLDPESAAVPVAVKGGESLEDVVLVDQSAVGRTIRSNAATFLNAFDAIRAAFAATPEAKLRDLKPGAFSFNSARGGRCPHCRGTGVVRIDMQFLPDIEMVCPECGGARFRKDILEIKLRGRSIAEVLDMTTDEAFAFFRNHIKVLRRIAPLKEVGLGYLPLGQPTSTLSGGEIQRLKIASFLAERTTKRTLFLFDEPTVGLHESDVVTLIDCFRRLIAVGHSIIAIEHRPQFLRETDWLIDLGPGAGPHGGGLVASGPPAHIAGVAASATGRFLQAD